jgi:hypothetical protein
MLELDTDRGRRWGRSRRHPHPLAEAAEDVLMLAKKAFPIGPIESRLLAPPALPAAVGCGA